MHTRQTTAQILASLVATPPYQLNPPSTSTPMVRQEIGGFTPRLRTGAILLPGKLDH